MGNDDSYNQDGMLDENLNNALNLSANLGDDDLSDGIDDFNDIDISEDEDDDEIEDPTDDEEQQ